MGGAGIIIANGAMNAGIAAMNNSWADANNQASMARAFGYNEAAARNADQRTRKLYADLYSPEAILRQYREAGLSPSLMFGGGAGAGGTTPQGAQGEGASGMQTQTFGMTPFDIAQTDLMKAQTRKLNAEAANEEGTGEKGKAVIENIVADTAKKAAEKGLINASEKLTEANKAWQDLLTEKGTETFWADVNKANAEAEYMYAKVQEAYADARIKIKDAEFAEDTFEDKVQQYRNDTLIKAREILLKDSQIELTKEQSEYFDSLTEKTYNDISYEWAQLQQDLDKFNKSQDLKERELAWDNYNKRMDRKVKSLELKLKRRDIELRHADRKAKTFVSTVNTIVATFGLGALKSGSKKKTTERYNPNGSSDGWEIETYE